MIKFKVEVTNPTGFHARPASILVKEAAKYKSDILFDKNGKICNCKSIMSILAGGVSNGDVLEFSIEGEDEAEAAKGIEKFILDNMSE